VNLFVGNYQFLIQESLIKSTGDEEIIVRHTGRIDFTEYEPVFYYDLAGGVSEAADFSLDCVLLRLNHDLILPLNITKMNGMKAAAAMSPCTIIVKLPETMYIFPPVIYCFLHAN